MLNTLLYWNWSMWSLYFESIPQISHDPMSFEPDKTQEVLLHKNFLHIWSIAFYDLAESLNNLPYNSQQDLVKNPQLGERSRLKFKRSDGVRGSKQASNLVIRTLQTVLFVDAPQRYWALRLRSHLMLIWHSECVHVQPYQPALSAAWLFQRSMAFQPGQIKEARGRRGKISGVLPADHVNRLLANNFR